MVLLSLKVALAALLCCCFCCCLVQGDECNMEEINEKFNEFNEAIEEKIKNVIEKLANHTTGIRKLIPFVKDLSCKNDTIELREEMEKNECMAGSNNCSENADCRNTVLGFECSCRSGFTGNGSICTDIDECEDSDTLCGDNANCINLKDGKRYYCQCKEGFEKVLNICEDIDECERGLDDCEPPFSCKNTQGKYNCSCLAPYKLEGGSCELDCSDPSIHVDGLGCITPLLDLQSWLAARKACKKLGLKLLEDLKPEHFETIANHFLPLMVQRPFPWIGIRYMTWLTSKDSVANEVIAEGEDFLEGGCGNFDLRESKRGVWDTSCFDEEYALCQSIA